MDNRVFLQQMDVKLIQTTEPMNLPLTIISCWFISISKDLIAIFFESFRPGFVNEQRSTPNGTHPTSPRSPIIDLKVNNRL
jgi:hypothetical protein